MRRSLSLLLLLAVLGAPVGASARERGARPDGQPKDSAGRTFHRSTLAYDEVRLKDGRKIKGEVSRFKGHIEVLHKGRVLVFQDSEVASVERKRTLRAKITNAALYPAVLVVCFVFRACD